MGETRVRIDCPDCGAPGAAWSQAADTTEPLAGSHEGCPSPPPAEEPEPEPEPDAVSGSDTEVEVTGDVDVNATFSVGAEQDEPADDEEHATSPLDEPDDACQTCGAVGDDPCITSSGNEALQPHAGRGE